MSAFVAWFQALPSWVTTNSDSILAGILSSVIVILLQSIAIGLGLAIASALALKWRLRTIWRLRNPQFAFVLSGSIADVSEDVRSVILAGPDADAASKIVATLGLLYPAARLRHAYSSGFPTEMYKETIICVGGPLHNRSTKQLLSNFPTIRFDEFSLIAPDNNIYETEYDDADVPIEDYGLIIRARNPYDEVHDVIILAGCDTYGVLAAALAISADPGAKRIRRQLARNLGFARFYKAVAFAAVVRCAVLENDVAKIELVHVWRL